MPERVLFAEHTRPQTTSPRRTCSTARSPFARLCWVFLLMAFLMTACAPPLPETGNNFAASGASPSPSPLPEAPPKPSPVPPLPTPRAFPQPRRALASPLPPLADPLPLPAGTRILLLAGQTRPQPYAGPSDLLTLFLYHPETARLAVVPLDPDLYGYLPGETTQRLSVAYALGGSRLLLDALDYNLGLRPDLWLIANTADLALLVDELGGLDVVVSRSVPEVCAGRVRAGKIFMDGETALCYATFPSAEPWLERCDRQQQILRLLLQRFLSAGNLRRAPELLILFTPRLDTNLTVNELKASFPVLLAQSDPAQAQAFPLGAAQSTPWEISAQPPATVQIPVPSRVRGQLLRAAEFLALPRGESLAWATASALLTRTPLPQTPSVTPTQYITAPPTATPLPGYPAPDLPTATPPVPAETPTPSPQPSPYPPP